MPRKKKKDSFRPLTFAESPIDGSFLFPTPVRCVDDPPTADIIPLDGRELPWVSPQFKSCPERNIRPKRGKGKQKNKSISPEDVRKLNPKTVPLKFLGESTESPDVETRAKTPRKSVAQYFNTNRRTSVRLRLRRKSDEVTSPDLDPWPEQNSQGFPIQDVLLSCENNQNDTLTGKYESSVENDENHLSGTQIVRKTHKSRRLFDYEASFLEKRTKLKSVSLISPETPPHVKGHVLAPDTPDNEKGLTLRQRQMRYYKLQKLLKSQLPVQTTTA